jgi:5-methylcytosine-specific restriction endonuclease McrA
MDTKLCRGCSQVLPWSAFYLRNGRPRTECKRCEHARTTAWRQTDKGKASNLAVTRKYNASEVGRERRAAYRGTEADRESKRRYAKTVKGRAALKRANATAAARERKRRYYENGKGKIATARYQQTPKGRESLLRGVHKRRALRMALPPAASTLTLAEWEEIKATHGHACVYCGRTDRPLTRDHVIPLSKGGHHTKENILPACRSCNSRRSNQDRLRPMPGIFGSLDPNPPA